ILSNDTRLVRGGYFVIQERNVNNSVTREYAWGLSLGGGVGGLLHLIQGTQAYSCLYDGKGNVVQINDSLEASAAQYSYDPFGAIIASSASIDQPFQFSTKAYDGRTGLADFGYRFYSPQLGRWLRRDPLGVRGGINVYSFTRNNPISTIDPLGLYPSSDPTSLVGLGLIPPSSTGDSAPCPAKES